MAYPTGPSNNFSDIHVSADVSHVGNSYIYGPTEDQQILQSILQSLHYPEMGQRGRDVPDAGADTFEWLFEGWDGQASHSSDEAERDESRSMDGEGGSNEAPQFSGDGKPVLKLVEVQKKHDLTCPVHSYERKGRNDMSVELRRWLKDNKDSVFWVTGKPGSGKSTFMKFLRDHDGTEALLQEWAQDDRLIFADHFFWLPGTPLQNSFEGLARSLMYAVLASLTADITSAKTICGKQRWSLRNSQRPWSHRDFKRMFKNLGAIQGTRVFILVDGLDECCPQHSHDYLMDTLMDLLQWSNIKTCFSSRPWKEFATRLDRSPSVRLDQITRLDMSSYVISRICRATQEQKLTTKEVTELVDLVVSRADGVFLWVELVVRAVNVELKKGRGLSRVARIVQDLPSELDEYFTMLIYDRIEKTSGNISDTASVLSLSIQLEEQRAPGNLYKRRAFRYGFINFWLLSRGALDHAPECPDIETPKYDQDQVAMMLEQTRSFLELASKDLLVLRYGDVEFLHRTVFDFLMNGSVNEAIRQRSPPHFQRSDFVTSVQALRCVHVLMMSDLPCQTIDNTMHFIAGQSGLEMTTRRNLNAMKIACESLAIDHVHNSQGCCGERGLSWHHVNVTSNRPSRFRMLPMPYRYVKALFRHWPHIAITDLLEQRIEESKWRRMSISRMRLRDLCSACTDIMRDCLYSGAIPDEWIAPVETVPRKFDPTEASKIFVQSDDGPRRSLCEFCGVHLPCSEDCGLRDTFFLFEKIAFELLFPNDDLLTQAHSESPTLEGRTIKSLPFELPWSMLHKADDLQALKATLRFRRFVWCRQKLRAVQSLLTAMRIQLDYLATIRPLSRSSQAEHYMDGIQAVWLDFLGSFTESPAWRGKKGQCGLCSKSLKYSERSVVSLRSDDLLRFCESCYKPAAPQLESKSSFEFPIWLWPKVTMRSEGELWGNRGIVNAISTIIAWYSETAPAFGLGYLIPSDIKEIQRALLEVPEIHD